MNNNTYNQKVKIYFFYQIVNYWSSYGHYSNIVIYLFRAVVHINIKQNQIIILISKERKYIPISIILSSQINISLNIFLISQIIKTKWHFTTCTVRILCTSHCCYTGMNLNLWLIFKKTILSTNLLVYSTINVDI